MMSQGFVTMGIELVFDDKDIKEQHADYEESRWN